MLVRILFDSIIGVFIVGGLLLAWNFPNPIGEHDVVESKLGLNASFECDILLLMGVFFTISVVCHYKSFVFVDIVHGIGNSGALICSVLVLMVSSESLIVSGNTTDLLSNKFFVQFDNDTDREAQLMFWTCLLLFSFLNVSFWTFKHVVPTVNDVPPVKFGDKVKF